MFITEITERAIISAMGGLNVTFRAGRVDDDDAAPTERKKYPCMTIIASSSKATTESLFSQVVCAVTLTTHYTDDPKRTVLAGLEDEFRTILDVGIKAQWDAIAAAAGETRYYKGLTEIDGGPVELFDSKEQSITTTMKIHTCGS